MKNKNGIKIKQGQTWKSLDGEWTSYVVGTSSEGFVVIEIFELGHGLKDIEHHHKSMFFGSITKKI
tara:strand:+ start:1155 stop:1352 length:198 start_codon:yes stop_codon:yes gene_type:complete